MNQQERFNGIRAFVQWLEDTATFRGADLSKLLRAEQEFKKDDAEEEDETGNNKYIDNL